MVRRPAVFLSVVLMLACASPLAAQQSNPPATATRVTLNIPAQPLQAALNEFARQTGLQVIVRDVDVAPGLNSSAIVGTFAPEAALRQLLANSGLNYGYLNERTIAIRSAKPGKARDSQSSWRRLDGTEEALRLALAPSDAPLRGQSEKKEPPAEEGSEAGVPEMLVKGAKALNTDIKRTEDDPQPYVVFDREQIERSMARNLSDFFKNRLPMNTVQGTPSQATTINSPDGNQSLVTLRGLGANQTLILVDGHRMPNINRGGVFGQPDINGIPLSIVERIEVLPSTASGIYGGGATGGVINIITRQDYVGLDAGLSYNNVFDSDAGERRVDLSAGLNLEGGRTQILLAGSYADSNELLFADRDFVERGRALQYANNRSVFDNATTPPAGYTSNIRSSNGQPLRLKAGYGGALLSSNHTFVPVGYAGPTSDNAAGLIANIGKYNLDVPNDIDGGQSSLANNPQIGSATLNLRRSFGSRVEAFVDASWFDNEGRMSIGGLPATTTLTAAAPNNPFTNTIVVAFPATGTSFPFLSISETKRATGGVIVRLPAQWTAAADYVWSRSSYYFELTSPGAGDPDGFDGPLPAVEDDLAAGVLDVMRDINRFPINYSPYAIQSPTTVTGPSRTELKDANLRLSGPLFRLPGGSMTLSAAVSRRDEKAQASFQDFFDGFESSVIFNPPRTQSVDSYYLETRMPLLRMLELQGSVRRDEYETAAPNPGSFFGFTRDDVFGPFVYSTNHSEATRYTAGLRFSPLQDLTLRASIGTGFLPPSIHQILMPTTTRPTLSLIDPKRGSVAASVGPFNRTSGSNPNLTPEDSESWSAGMIFTPRFLPDLRLSIDYTNIEKTNEISTLSIQQILDLENYLPAGRVTRNALSSADAALGYTGGTITAIDLTLINLARARLEAFDVQVDYLLRTGDAGVFQFHALVTYQPEFARQTLPTAPFVDFIGFSNGQLEWRGNAGVTWEKNQWAVDWNTQYFDQYRAYSATAVGAAITNAILNQGSAFIPGQMYHDLFLHYRFAGSGSGFFDDLEVSFGIQNLLDEIPPILATTAATGGYSTYGDARLRRYSIGLRKHF